MKTAKTAKTEKKHKAISKGISVDVEKIPQQGLQIKQEYDSSILDLDVSNLHVDNPVKVEVNFTKITNTVSVDARVEAKAEIVCSRCLKELDKKLENNFRFNYLIEPHTKVLDITEDLRQEIIIGYPIKLLCNPDCKGLCPKCGENLNQGLCRCQMKPRLTER